MKWVILPVATATLVWVAWAAQAQQYSPAHTIPSSEQEFVSPDQDRSLVSEEPVMASTENSENEATFSSDAVVVDMGDGQQHVLAPEEVCRRQSNNMVVCSQAQNEADEPSIWLAVDPPAPEHPMQRYCPSTPENALGLFVRNMHSGDLNRVIESYAWRNKSEAAAEAIIDALGRIPMQGEWERKGGRARWVPTDPQFRTTYFVLRKDQGCWFLEFATHSAATVDETGVSQDNVEGADDLGNLHIQE